MKNEIKFLGENLYKFRKEKGISQEELANKINVSRQAVYKWETGERIPDITNLNALCMEFNKSIEDFIEGAEYLVKTETNNEETVNENKESLQEKNNSKKLKKIVKVILIIIFLIYILSIIIKAIFFTVMFTKLDKYKGSNNYMYQVKFGNYEIESPENDYYVQYKDGIQKIFYGDSKGITAENWYYYKSPEEKFTYGIYIEKTQKEREEWKYTYSYSEGFVYKDPSPYELASEIAKKNYNIINVVNPFYILKFDLKNKDLILEDYEKDPKMQNQVYIRKVKYIDLETGLLSKKEEYELDELISYSAYFNYEFDKITYSLELSEEIKKQIIEGAKRQEEELLKQEELLNKEN